jgi:hypothetical protein
MYINKSFEDSDTHWAQEAIEALAGLINGTNARVYPNANTTRAEVAQLLYNLLIELYH